MAATSCMHCGAFIDPAEEFCPKCIEWLNQPAKDEDIDPYYRKYYLSTKKTPKTSDTSNSLTNQDVTDFLAIKQRIGATHANK